VVNGELIGRLGVAAQFPAQPVGVAEILPRTVGEMGSLLKGSLVGMKDFAMNFGDFTGNLVSEDPSSNRPVSVVGLVEVGGDVGRDSAANLLFLIAAFNIFVGVFNYLPLLPLDGGHAAVATYERLRSRPGQRYEVDMAKLLPVTYAVVMFLVFLGIASLYLDIRFGIDVGS
jgi:membrane-associated protease RseP (regulator of RpoE activity)